MRRYMLYVLTVVVLTIFWVGLEYMMDGQIIGQRSDLIMCLVLSWFVMDWVDCYIFEG